MIKTLSRGDAYTIGHDSLLGMVKISSSRLQTLLSPSGLSQSRTQQRVVEQTPLLDSVSASPSLLHAWVCVNVWIWVDAGWRVRREYKNHVDAKNEA